jgi:hypothetical protein
MVGDLINNQLVETGGHDLICGNIQESSWRDSVRMVGDTAGFTNRLPFKYKWETPSTEAASSVTNVNETTDGQNIT